MDRETILRPHNTFQKTLLSFSLTVSIIIATFTLTLGDQKSLLQLNNFFEY